jgi:hypothetical protein
MRIRMQRLIVLKIKDTRKLIARAATRIQPVGCTQKPVCGGVSTEFARHGFEVFADGCVVGCEHAERVVRYGGEEDGAHGACAAGFLGA